MEYYRQSVDSILKGLGADANGLSQSEVDKRLKEEGYNQIETKSEIHPFKIFIAQFKSFIIYILLFAVVFSLLIGEYVDSVIILLILLANALIGFFQELNAEKSLEALKKMTQITANVYRDGKMIKVDSKFLVPGDIIHLEAGDKVPADARIIEANRMKVEEAALTGESVPEMKNPDALTKETPLGDRKSMLYSSTTIVEGTGKAVVVRTGMKTEIGKITDLLKQTEDTQTPLQKRLDSFGKKLGYVIIVICAIVFFASFLKASLNSGLSKHAVIEIIFVAISLAVAAIPEGLPAVVTIALSIGVKRLLKKKALVKNLSSVETLGSCDVICTDKTGTLTKNEMTVKKAWTLGEEADIEGLGYKPEGKVSNKLDDRLYKVGMVCNNASLFEEKEQWKITGDPTEAALIVSAKKAGVDIKLKRKDEIPFDSTRKMMSVLVEENGKLVTYTKGAPDQILKQCETVLVNGKRERLTKELRQKILKQNEAYASDEMRVLAFAYKEITDPKQFTEEELVFTGMQAMIDPPRHDVIESIKVTKKAGIRVIMITGDYKATAVAIGKEIGIEGKVLAGDEVEKLSDEELREALKDNTNIFARVIPEHKQRIVNALQELKYTVAMTGDGVNDAPALKKADIGVAVGSGTEVAKEASDFILLDDSFTNIVNAIEEGRGIYDNIQKSIMLLLSGNIGEVLIIFLAVVFGANLPLTAILLLWINLITDGAPALAYSVDPYGKDIMMRKPKHHAEGILPKSKAILIGALGFVGSIIALVIFYLNGGRSEGAELVVAQTIIFNFVVLYEIILVFLIRGDYNVKFFSNKWLWAAVVFSLGIQAILMYTPLRGLFKIAALGWSHMLTLAYAGAAFYIFAVLYYFILHKRFKQRLPV